MSSGSQPAASQPQNYLRVLAELQDEAISIAKISGAAVTSLVWLWPIRGLLHTVIRELKAFLQLDAPLTHSFCSSKIRRSFYRSAERC